MKVKELPFEIKETKHVMEEIKKVIAGIQYGEVVITIHNGKVVQLEKREKKRLSGLNATT